MSFKNQYQYLYELRSDQLFYLDLSSESVKHKINNSNKQEKQIMDGLKELVDEINSVHRYNNIRAMLYPSDRTGSESWASTSRLFRCGGTKKNTRPSAYCKSTERKGHTNTFSKQYR